MIIVSAIGLLSAAFSAWEIFGAYRYSVGSALQPNAGSVLDIGSGLQLFVDDYLIDHLGGGAELRLHHPVPQGIVMTYDQPWEGAGSGYQSIFRDGDIYRMYYKSWHRRVGPGAPNTDSNPLFCCYAESRDGIHWYKPKLGLFEYNGSKSNNIVMVEKMGNLKISVGEPAVFKDGNPGLDPRARYKALFPLNDDSGLIPFRSPDGIHWSALSKEPVITYGAFDSQNLAFWDVVHGEYRAYWRTFDKNVRGVRTATSGDFIHWGRPEDIHYDNSLSQQQLYTNQIKPYYRAPELFIGFPTRYIDRDWSASMRALPELQHREWRSGISPRFGTALTEALIMAGHDGVNFKCWNEAFLRPGIERPGSWTYGQQYIGWQMVETKSLLEGAPNEISLYATESYWSGNKASKLRRYTMRLDGFVSANAPMSGGELLTKTLTFTGSKMNLNFSSSAVGEIRVEIQDETGKPIPGFTAEDCPPIFGDTIERTVTWKSPSALSKLEGKAIRLRFLIKDADLYSFQFK